MEHAVDIDEDELLRELIAQLPASTRRIDGVALLQRLAAVHSFGQALGFRPGAIDFLYARAHQWFLVGRADRAEPLFRALCLLDDRVADFWVGFGVCLRLRGALEHALEAFETASRLRPTWAIPYFHMLELLVRREAWALAATQLAAFEANIDDTVAPELIVEAARYKTALELRNSAEKR